MATPGTCVISEAGARLAKRPTSYAAAAPPCSTTHSSTPSAARKSRHPCLLMTKLHHVTTTKVHSVNARSCRGL